jgi:hypothetical protein
MGLGEEIDEGEGKGLVVGSDEDVGVGGGEAGIHRDGLQDFHAGEPGHHQIQENDEGVGAAAEDVEG